MTLLSFVSVFLLVFGRLVGFLVAAPLFSSKQLPAQHKLAIAAGLAYFASYAVKTTVQVDDIDFFFGWGQKSLSDSLSVCSPVFYCMPRKSPDPSSIYRWV
ncbi:flagellar biosynthetic protein FliR [Exiguobacterium artemiae]